MSLVRFVLQRPYTVGSMLILICLLGIGAGLRMPIDIFPEINIPVVSVVWTYSGMSATDIQNRILSLHQRQMASLVDDIARIEATSYQGVGVEKFYLHEGADVSRAVSQIASSAPPKRKTLGSSTRWSGVIFERTRCGTIRPTKPMGPVRAIAPATRIEPVI